MTVVSNGHAPNRDDFEAVDERLAAVLDAEVSDLQEILDDELSARAQLQALFEKSKTREKRLRRAIAALSGESAQHTTQQDKATRQAGMTWHVSDEAVERVWAGFMKLYDQKGEPVTQTMVSDSMEGIGPDTVRKSLERLRSTERVRLAGKTRGGGKLWAPMPGGTDGA